MRSREQLVRLLILTLPFLGFVLIWDLAEHIYWTLACFALALAVLCFWQARWPAPSIFVVLAAAAVLRLLLVPLPPTLSDDVYRYVWDGRVAGSGLNPYVLAPDSAELVELRDSHWEKMGHRGISTVYPPLALTAFTVAARFPKPIVAWKLLLVTIELVTCWMLARLALSIAGSVAPALWYAWNPLAVVETAGMGHVDALGVCAVVLAVWALVSRHRPLTIASAAAAAILVKLVPVVAVPAWLRSSGRFWTVGALVAVILVLALTPVVKRADGVPPGYQRFAGSWEFNGPLYELLWRALDRADSPGWVAAELDRRKEETGEHEYWNRFYPFNYSRAHARLLLVPVAGVLLLLAWRRLDPVYSTALCFEAVLLCSATVYPWYLLWLLPFAGLLGSVPWLVLCSMGFLSYLAQFTELTLMPWVFVFCWAPYVLLRGAGRTWSAS